MFLTAWYFGKPQRSEKFLEDVFRYSCHGITWKSSFGLHQALQFRPIIQKLRNPKRRFRSWSPNSSMLALGFGNSIELVATEADGNILLSFGVDGFTISFFQGRSPSSGEVAQRVTSSFRLWNTLGITWFHESANSHRLLRRFHRLYLFACGLSWWITVQTQDNEH